jgi:hypothetical protein
MSLKKFISITVIVSVIHILIHIIQIQLYSGNFFSEQFNTIAYSIYMPHGTRILFFLIYGFWSIPGMFLAHIITAFNNDGFIAFDFIMIIAIIISVFCVPVAGIFIRNFFEDINKTQNFFTPSYIISLTLLSAFINASLTNILRLFTIFNYDKDRFLTEFFGYLFGDILGVIVIVFMFLILKRIFLISVEKV